MCRKKRIGILGGTFNPIHTGHIELGRQFAKRLRLDKILLIPTNVPPHKEASAVSGEHRLNMCRIAAEDACGVFEACDIELLREGKSYTYETLQQLAGMYPDARFYLIVGADMFMIFETWKRFDIISKMAVLCTVERGETDIGELRAYARRLRSLGAKCRIADIEPMDISSTMIRSALREGRSTDGMLAPRVLDYISEHELYYR